MPIPVKKITMKAKVPKYSHMHAGEISLTQRWAKEGKCVGEIAKLLGRWPKTVKPHMSPRAKTKNKGKVGRPIAISAAVFKSLWRSMQALLKKARGAKEVTVGMIKTHSHCAASKRCILDAFHRKGLHFRKLREKPLLAKKDLVARRAFAIKHGKKTKSSWLNCPHAVIDNKHFPLYLNKAGREYAARRAVRGAYRFGKQAVAPHLVKPKGGTMRFPTKSVIVTAAVIKGRIRM